MHADQNPGGLLLLRVWTARVPAQPCQELCQNGAGHVRGHQVSSSVAFSLLTTFLLVLFLNMSFSSIALM